MYFISRWYEFAVKPETVAKWVLNRPFQTRIVEALTDTRGASKTVHQQRKCLRSSEINRSNNSQENHGYNHFIIPFEQGLEHEKWYNGAPVEDSICESLICL